MNRDLFCDRCTLQFDKKYVFDLHLFLVHGEEIKVKRKPQICEEQSEKTPEKVCSDPDVETRFKCDICDSFFQTKVNLKEHIKSVHEEKKPFHCNICGADFTKKQNMNRHIASIHEGKKPFHCNICGTDFTTKKILNDHIASIHEKKSLLIATFVVQELQIKGI